MWSPEDVYHGGDDAKNAGIIATAEGDGWVFRICSEEKPPVGGLPQGLDRMLSGHGGNDHPARGWTHDPLHNEQVTRGNPAILHGVTPGLEEKRG